MDKPRNVRLAEIAGLKLIQGPNLYDEVIWMLAGGQYGRGQLLPDYANSDSAALELLKAWKKANSERLLMIVCDVLGAWFVSIFGDDKNRYCEGSGSTLAIAICAALESTARSPDAAKGRK